MIYQRAFWLRRLRPSRECAANPEQTDNSGEGRSRSGGKQEITGERRHLQ
jgi:hypothetical protein